ncbi:hypothetical protein Tco_1050552 [Tanacetum coccineum]
MDTRGIKSVLKHEEMYSGAANGNHTKTQRGADNVSLYRQGGGKRDPFNRKRLTTSTNLLRQLCLANPKNKLQFNGKTGLSIGACHKKADEKFNLEAFDITYRPMTSIHNQNLANFIAERPDEEGPSTEEQAE